MMTAAAVRRLAHALILVPVLVVLVVLVLTPTPGQSQPLCPEGSVPATICLHVPSRACENPPEMPMASQIRRHLALYLIEEAPESLKPTLSDMVSWQDDDLRQALASATVAARCFSGNQPGPANPATVPADEVKTWVLAVLDDGTVAHRAARPLIAALPARAVRVAYLRAVELKRGLPFGSLEKPTVPPSQSPAPGEE